MYNTKKKWKPSKKNKVNFIINKWWEIHYKNKSMKENKVLKIKMVLKLWVME